MSTERAIWPSQTPAGLPEATRMPPGATAHPETHKGRYAARNAVVYQATVQLWIRAGCGGSYLPLCPQRAAGRWRGDRLKWRSRE